MSGGDPQTKVDMVDVTMVIDNQAEDSGQNHVSTNQQEGHSPNSNQHTQDPATLKDSKQAWKVCFAAFLIQVLVVGVLHCFGVFFVVFLKEFHCSKAEAAWVGSIAYGITMLLGPLTSILINRFGNRVSAISGSIICTISLVISSFVNSIEALFVTFSILYGTGTSLAYTPTMTIAGDYFDKYVTMATGMMVAGSSVGTLVLSPLAQVLITTVGWRNAFRVLAVFTLAGVWSGWMFKPLQPTPKTPAQRIKTSLARRLMTELHLWKNKVYVIWVVAITFVMFGYYIPYIHLVSHAEDIGISTKDGSILMMILGASTATGRVLFGKIVEFGYLNRLHMQQFSMLITGTAIMLLPLIRSFDGLIAYVVLTGLVDGCYVVLLPTLTCTLAGTENKVTAWGFLVGISSITYTFGPPVAGWIYDATGNYNIAFHVAGVPIILGALILFFIPWAQRTAHSTNIMAAVVHDYEVMSPTGLSDEHSLVETNSSKGDDQLFSITSQHDINGCSSNTEVGTLKSKTSLMYDEMNDSGRMASISGSQATSDNIPDSVKETIEVLKKQSKNIFEFEQRNENRVQSPLSYDVSQERFRVMSPSRSITSGPSSRPGSVHNSLQDMGIPPRMRSPNFSEDLERDKEISNLFSIDVSSNHNSSTRASIVHSPISPPPSIGRVRAGSHPSSPLPDLAGYSSPGIGSPMDSFSLASFSQMSSNPSLPPLMEIIPSPHPSNSGYPSAPPGAQLTHSGSSSTPFAGHLNHHGRLSTPPVAHLTHSGPTAAKSNTSLSGEGEIFQMSDINLASPDE